MGHFLVFEGGSVSCDTPCPGGRLRPGVRLANLGAYLLCRTFAGRGLVAWRFEN